MDGKELMPRATLDVQDMVVDEGSWKYVLIGKKNGEECYRSLCPSDLSSIMFCLSR